MAVCYWVKHIFTRWSSIPTPRFLPKRKKNICPHKDLWKKENRKDYTLYDSIFVKFYNRINYSNGKYGQWLPGAGGQRRVFTAKPQEKLFRVMKMFHVLIAVLVLWSYVVANIHLSVHLKWVNFAIWKLYLKKDGNKYASWTYDSWIRTIRKHTVCKWKSH